MTQKGAAFISLSYFHNEVLLIHEHNYIVLFAFCVAGREQRAELLLETPGITSLLAWCSRGCSEFLCLCPGTKWHLTEHSTCWLIPSHPQIKTPSLQHQSQFSYCRGSGAWAGPCWEQAGAFSKPEQTGSLSTSRSRGQQVQILHLFKFCLCKVCELPPAGFTSRQ